MSPYLAIVAYRCLVAGTRRGMLNIQVQWHEAADEGVVRSSIASKPIYKYLNSDDDVVSWELSGVLAVEPFTPKQSGDEVVGFIASIRQLRNFA